MREGDCADGGAPAAVVAMGAAVNAARMAAPFCAGMGCANGDWLPRYGGSAEADGGWLS